jgi:hypothetical protein
MPLNNVRIEAAKPRSKPYKLGDEKGLYLLVQPATRPSSSAWA